MPNLLWVMIAAYILGACGAWVAGRRELGRWLTAIGAGVGSAAAFSLGLSALLAPAVPPLTWVSGTSIVSLALRLDGLGAFFLVTVGLIGLAAAIYGFNYSAAYAGRYSLGRLGFLFNLLLLTLCLQVMADNAFTFLFLWEVMSLAAYGLVLT